MDLGYLVIWLFYLFCHSGIPLNSGSPPKKKKKKKVTNSRKVNENMHSGTPGRVRLGKSREIIIQILDAKSC
jgi:hypothetical protein